MAKIDREYFKWLTSKIEVPESNPNSYMELFSRMHDTEFVWHVSHDDDRIQDGLDLRVQFLYEIGRNGHHDFKMGASVLEVLIALSVRVAFTAGGPAEIWAWQLIENLRLDNSSDPLTEGKANRVDDVLEALIWRTYKRDGQGGFFPLPDGYVGEDQAKVDIWNQMNAYVIEIRQL